MSENSAGTTKAEIESPEPSMEDILASIRKIISDDAVDDVVDPGVEGSVGLSRLGTDFELNEIDREPSEASTKALPVKPVTLGNEITPEESIDVSLFLDDFDSDELDKLLSFEDADDALSDLKIPDSEGQAAISDVPVADTVQSKVDEPIETLVVAPEPDISFDELEAFSKLEELELSTDVEADLKTEALPVPDEAAPTAALAMEDFTSDFDLDFMSEDLVSDVAITQDAVEDTALDAEDSVSSEDDMDLVKSLMADLTDDSFLMDDEVSDTDDAELESDFLDDMMTSNLDQEALASDESLNGIMSVESPEVSQEPIALSKAPVDLVSKDATPKLSALAALAQRASVDADEVEAKPSRDSILDQVWKQDAVDEAQMAPASLSAQSDDLDHPHVEAPLTQKTQDISTESDIKIKQDVKESVPMQRAIRSDAILDEVTEEAASGAFAKLNTVVEEKAVFAERGDRIGDLVLEALRPMLKEWLDGNLKGIVERAVAKEVKRISTGK